MKKCALCGEENEIKLSHIVPAFVGRHLKKTSVGNIRNMEDPNKTVQDLEKHYLLCHDCEERFSASERWFAREVFYPWKKNEKTEFDYNFHMHYFITSLSWRSLYLDILNYVQEGTVDVSRLNVMIQSEQIMKEYLWGKRNDIGNIENHIFFFERIREVHSSKDNAFYSNPHMTIHRSVTSYTHYSNDTIFTVSNMMGIIPVTLYEKGYREQWKGTEVICGDGKVLAANQHITSVVCSEFQYWIEESTKQREKMTETQKQKVIQRMKDIGEDIVNYDIYQDYIDDKAIKY